MDARLSLATFVSLLWPCSGRVISCGLRCRTSMLPRQSWVQLRTIFGFQFVRPPKASWRPCLKLSPTFLLLSCHFLMTITCFFAINLQISQSMWTIRFMPNVISTCLCLLLQTRVSSATLVQVSVPSWMKIMNKKYILSTNKGICQIT
jgi:hypothetical protein